MPNGLVVLRRGVTLTFLGHDMQHFGAAVVLDLTQDTYQTHYVMTVGRTEITDVETREDIAGLLTENSLQTVVTTQHRPPFAFVHQVQLLRDLVQTPTPFIVRRTGRQVHQVLRDTAFERIDGHMVVVQHDQQVVLIHRGVVKTLKGQTTRHGTIPYDSHYIALAADIHS